MMTRYKKNSYVAFWLFLCCTLVMCMVVLGGLTRLTDSGLSMTDWRPVTGIMPPLNQEQWQVEFSQYRQSPEYQHINAGMSLDEFKGIFWLEYFHRLLGRLVGVVFVVPFAMFALKGWLGRDLSLKLFGILLLGAAQGGIGWMMVKSGLQNMPYVSHFWLAFHLIMAFLIFACLFWLGLGQTSLKAHERFNVLIPNNIFVVTKVVLVSVLIQTMFGGFVAGLHGGLIYNTFPLMGGGFIPPEIFHDNLITSPVGVQFLHRLMAYGVIGLVGYLVWLILRANVSRWFNRVSCLLLVVVGLQFLLGVATLLLHVPISLAVFHQAGAMILFAVALYMYFGLYMCQQSSKGKSI